MINPLLFSATPHRSPSAFTDLIGTVSLLHRQHLVPAITALTGTAVAVYPLDASASPRDLLQAIQQQHLAESVALGIAPPPDLSTFDLDSAVDWASWTFLLATDLNRLRQAAGII